MTEIPTLPTWPLEATCRGVTTRWWFPARGEVLPGPVRDACSACPVASECLTAAMTTCDPPIKFGVWGGLSEKLRRQLRRHGTVRTSRVAARWDGTTAVVVPVKRPDLTPGEARRRLLEFDAETAAMRAAG